jgi:hypothetical protein
MLALVVLLPMAYVVGRPYTTTLPRPFDSGGWKSDDVWGYARCAMIADLRLRVGIEGKTRGELIYLLGPDENEVNDASLSHWHLCPSFMDIWILEVRWKDGIAEDSWVRES